MTPEEQEQLEPSRKGRNIALGVSLLFFAFLFYFITIARMGN